MSATGDARRPRLFVVLGPTGTGKSALALELARRVGGEIVGCDASQLYRGFDAATAKPSPAARREVPHHLVDCVDPRQDVSMADWVREAERTIAAIDARAGVPIVAGGSGLYLRGLLRGVIAAPARDPALRRRLVRVAERRGTAALWRALARRDPASARRLHPGDRQRLVRALELALLPGASWSDRLDREGTWSSPRERYPSLKLGLDMERALLARRLEARVERFFAAGLVDEVRGLLASGVPAEANAFRAIGYREVLTALSGGLDPNTVSDLVQRSTRRYAKRQRTWFAREPGVVWLDAARAIDALAGEALSLWSRDGGGGEPATPP